MRQILTMAWTLLMAVAMQGQTISFTAAEWATAKSLQNGAAVTDYTKDGVTVTFAQGTGASAPSYNSGYSAIAAVSGNTMTIVIPEGKQLRQAVFTMYNATMANNLTNAAWSGGSAAKQSTEVTWTGTEESLTVTFSAMEGFVAFSVTFSEPPVDPELSYNDTTVLNIPAYITKWQEDNPWDEWPEGYVDSVRFNIDDKSVFAWKIAEEEFDKIEMSTDYLHLNGGSTLTISAPYKMKKVVLTLRGVHSANSWVNYVTCFSGEMTVDPEDTHYKRTVIWTGSTAELTFYTGVLSPELTEITIISDTTDNKATVTFYDFLGQVIKTEPVIIGGSATAPTLEDECFAGWDKDFTNVQGDLEVNPIKRDLLFFTIDEWKELYGTWRIPQATKGDYTIYSEYYEGGGIGEDPIVIDGVRYDNRLLIYSGYQYIKAAEPFNNLTFVCRYESSAANLAAATWSSGVVAQDGLYVHWKGYTDSLRWDLPDASYQICAYRIECTKITEYTVTFYDVNGNVLKRDTVARGGSATAPIDMEQTGYNFLGWDTDFTNLSGENPLLYVNPIYEEAEGYVTVTFVGIDGNVLQKSRVLIGGNVTAPEAPIEKFYVFVGWDHALTNITENTTIHALYEIDSNSPDILTLEQWRAASKQEGEYYAVRGIMTYIMESHIDEDGTLSFYLNDSAYANNGAALLILHSLGLNGTPFFHSAQIQQGDTLIVYGQYGVRRISGNEYWGLKDGYLLDQKNGTNRENMVYLTMPDAQVLYDFNGDGKKQVANLTIKSYNVDEQVPGCDCRHTNIDLTIASTTSLAEGFMPQDTMVRYTFENLAQLGYSPDTRILNIEDVNRDGKPEFATATQLWMSQNDAYSLELGAFAITNMDLNNDGRLDYLLLKNNTPSPYGQIAYQAADGSFSIEAMKFVSSTPSQAGVRKAQSIGNRFNLPMTAIDLNGDGLMDLVNENSGMLYINKGNGQWEWKSMGAHVILTDLNNDGLTDFVLPSEALTVAIYNPTTQDYVTTALQSTGMVDDVVYCRDFDKDGDIDLLVTFSAFYNGNVSYTCYFINNGQGQFTKQNEQNYGTDNPLWFSTCQDIDGDGYYDLLAIRGNLVLTPPCKTCGDTYTANYAEMPEVVWLRGSVNNTFAAPQKLYEPEFPSGWSSNLTVWLQNNSSVLRYPRNSYRLHLNAEDLDGNGTTRVWYTYDYTDIALANGTTELYPVPAVAANERPTAPAQPTVQYNDGLLTVTWGNGSDSHTAQADLTYALRIGTSSGTNDILAAHAKADGNRRNCLDGNMGRAHSYTIDLRSYAPSDIYVAVQAIDAQHAGSVWSEEATVAHTAVPVAISLSRSQISLNETVEVHYTAIPEGYTHSWRYEDGELVKDSTYLVLRFPTGGYKTITHIVTMPDGAKDSASVVLSVTPAAVDSAITLTDVQKNILRYPFADYTYDGLLDGLNTVVYEGDNTELFKQALGMWNSGLLADGESTSPEYVRWYDWNRDGHVDLLYHIYSRSGQSYAHLLHDPAALALTAKEYDNERLPYFLGYSYTNYTTYNYFSLKSDMQHVGFEECVLNTTAPNGKDIETKIIHFNDDGTIGNEDFTIIGDANQFHKLMQRGDQYIFIKDFDHDGFADIAGLGYRTSMNTETELPVFYNRGNGVYEQHNIPFPEAIQITTFTALEDLNGDGYPDLIAIEEIDDNNTDRELCSYVLWNNGNQSFTKEVLPNSTHKHLYNNEFVLSDVDNNGYLDIVSPMPTEIETVFDIYVWYMGAEGLLNHGMLIPEATETGIKDMYLAQGKHYLYANKQLYPVIAVADERPAAPTNIQATMTEAGLLLTWDAAVDDHTPATLMRYNLSMKLQGASTYLFSPQNGGNDQAMYIPGYNYINATRFFIPTSVLNNGNYEIRLQAVDNQNKMSVFSETLVYNVVRNPIEAPATTCAWNYTSISYQGADETGTPVWDFGGGVVYNGSGFGPYTIYWQSGGEKVIALTLGDTIYRDTIHVSDPYELPIYPPQDLYEDVPFTVSLPEGVTCAWYARLNDDTEWHKVDGTGILLDASYILIYDRRLKVNGATITAYLLPNESSLCNDKLELRFEFTTPDGCTGIYEYVVTVRPQTNIPTLSLVTTDANGHNAISWTNVDAFNSINVYKEGNTLNDFQLIGYANASDGAFTDANSDATQKAERYRITGISANGTESPASTIHKTVHLTINRGVMDGTFNLIWNAYEGASIASYNILRGATPTSLAEIATVAASNTSYTDQAPVDAQPYYAVEYVLSAAANAPAANANRAPAAALSGRSNVVDRNNLTPQPPQPQNGITVRLYPNEWNTVYLYAWTGNGETQPCGAWPGTAVSKDAEGWWTYTFDPSITSINIIWNNGAGYQTYDITSVTASTCYQIGEFTGLYNANIIDCNTPIGQTKNYLPYNLQVAVSGTTVTFSWAVQDLPTYFGIGIYYGSQEVFLGTTMNNNTSLTLSSFFEQFGTYTWKLCGANENRQQITEWVDGPSFEIRDPHEGIDTPDSSDKSDSSIRKILINGEIFILRGDKTYTLTGQEVK